MDRPGHELLAGPALAADDNREIAFAKVADKVEDKLHGIVLADDAPIFAGLRELLLDMTPHARLIVERSDHANHRSALVSQGQPGDFELNGGAVSSCQSHGRGKPLQARRIKRFAFKSTGAAAKHRRERFVTVTAEHFGPGNSGKPFGAAAEKEYFSPKVVRYNAFGKAFEDVFGVFSLLDESGKIAFCKKIAHEAFDGPRRFQEAEVRGSFFLSCGFRVYNVPVDDGRGTGKNRAVLFRAVAQGNNKVKIHAAKIGNGF